MNTFITKKNARRSDVWRKFLELRVAGKEPVLLDTAVAAAKRAGQAGGRTGGRSAGSRDGRSGGRSLIFVPDERQDDGEEGGVCRKDFCPRTKTQPENLVPGPNFRTSTDDRAWVGFHTYDQGLEWMGIASKHTPRQKQRLPKSWGRFCREVYEFEVEVEDGAEFLATQELRADNRESDFLMGEVQPGISKQEYFEALAAIKKALREGETYQVNFAQELRADFRGDPFALYAAMFTANPSAMCFFAEGRGEGGGDDGDDGEPWAVCSNSPERLFSLRTELGKAGEDGRAVMRTEPIKGTVARDEDPQFLLRDEKSYAELTMIVDLMRNDFGKVARPGSVKVLEHQALMELSHVWHTYSVIEAELAEGKDARDVLRAVFPGGSVTGCPKHRTMQIIDRLENFTRGAYCGSAGYILPGRPGRDGGLGDGARAGDADFNIMIRTATVQGGKVSFPVGGAIVWDSEPESEYQETWDKAGAFMVLNG